MRSTDRAGQRGAGGVFWEQGHALQSPLRWEAELNPFRKARVASVWLGTPKRSEKKETFAVEMGCE